MNRDAADTMELRKAAVRMVAAAEYFKAAGDLPPWAHAELQAWDDDDAAAPTRPPSGAGTSEP